MAATRVGEYYDRQEVRDAPSRRAQVFNALPGLVRHAIDNAPAIAERLSGVDPTEINTSEALARLPVLRKADLMARQRANLPFGGLVATPNHRLAKLFCSPGPIYDPESPRIDYWRLARAMFAAQFRHGDLIHNAFSYHLTPAGSMVEGAARALACPVIPAGTGQTERQVQIIHELKPTAYAGTPSFLSILLERAAADGLDSSSITKALVSGEAFPPTLRDELRHEHGIEAFECYATADVGLIGYETSAREGLVVDEAVLLEIVRPGTDDPVPEGEVGEVVVTTFNPDYPLIRYGTGDLSMVMAGESPCGRTNVRIKGWMGRADQSAKVRGMFVHPSQMREITVKHSEIRRLRLEVSRDADQDALVLKVETPFQDARLGEAISSSMRAVTGLRSEVELVACDSLPNDGKVIDDKRG
ncbi:MAG: phenylacetate--CoA ligase family protein [Geminicoccaceae bacterium]